MSSAKPPTRIFLVGHIVNTPILLAEDHDGVRVQCATTSMGPLLVDYLRFFRRILVSTKWGFSGLLPSFPWTPDTLRIFTHSIRVLRSVCNFADWRPNLQCWEFASITGPDAKHAVNGSGRAISMLGDVAIYLSQRIEEYARSGEPLPAFSLPCSYDKIPAWTVRQYLGPLHSLLQSRRGSLSKTVDPMTATYRRERAQLLFVEDLNSIQHLFRLDLRQDLAAVLGVSRAELNQWINWGVWPTARQSRRLCSILNLAERYTNVYPSPEATAIYEHVRRMRRADLHPDDGITFNDPPFIYPVGRARAAKTIRRAKRGIHD